MLYGYYTDGGSYSNVCEKENNTIVSEDFQTNISTESLTSVHSRPPNYT